LGPGPATLRVNRIIAESITGSSMSIMSQEVNCKNPGEAANRITSLGYTENPKFKAKSMEPPYNVQIPSNRPVLINLGFRKTLSDRRVCSLAFSFVPEPGAVYQLTRRFHTRFFDLGECSFDLSRVVVSEQGETITQLKNYLWGPLAGFENGRYVCDQTGNYTVKPPKRTRRPWDKVTSGAEQSPSAKVQSYNMLLPVYEN
jgi:hypothetical protein